MNKIISSDLCKSIHRCDDPDFDMRNCPFLCQIPQRECDDCKERCPCCGGDCSKCDRNCDHRYER